MRKFILGAMVLCGLVAAENSLGQNCKINIHLKNCTDSVAYLAHYFDGRIFADDTTRLTNGKGVFTKDKNLHEGIYMVYLPSKQFFDVLIGKQQQFSVNAIVNKQVEDIKVSGSEESEAFQKFQNFMQQQKQKSQQLQQKYKTEKSKQKKKKYQQQFDNLDKEVRQYIAGLDRQYPNTMVAKFAKATLSAKIPDFEEVAEDTPDRDKVIQRKKYYYNRKHYFDNIDFTDNRLLRTPILKNKLKFFFEKMLIQVPDTIADEAVKIIEQSKSDSICFQYYTQFALNYALKSNVMGMDAAFVELAKKYYLSGQAVWADSTLIAKINDRVIKLQSNLLGKTAPDLKMETIDGQYVRLSEVDASYTVVYFWEPDCGHCKKITPKLKTEVFDKYKNKGVKIFAVYTQNDRKLWGDAITKYNLFDFINCYDPSFFTNFRVLYDVYSTPTIYLLDKNKKIIAKRIDIESLKNILNHELKIK